jgi:hypothetical protein
MVHFISINGRYKKSDGINFIVVLNDQENKYSKIKI